MKRKLLRDSSELFYKVLIYTMVGMLSFICLFPLIYVIGMSFTSEIEMIRNNYFVIIPQNPTVNAYTIIFRQANFFSAMFVSVARTVSTTILCVTFVLIASYCLAEPKLPGRKIMLMFIIITMMISGGLIPTYLLFAQLRLLNKFIVLVVPGLGYTYGILVIKTFIEGIPGEIQESADMDGAGDLMRLVKIVIPLTTPSLAAIALFTAVGQWNSWFDAMVFIRSTELFPISLVIRNILAMSALQQTASSGAILMRVAPESIKMASVVVAMAPILCVYPFLQRYFIHGVFIGSLKG